MINGIEFMGYPTIDVHGHCGAYDGYKELQGRLANAPADEVVARAESCHIVMTLVSELGAFDAAPDRRSDVDAANRRAQVAVVPFNNLKFYAVVNPKNNSWKDQTQKLLKDPNCAGVKLHPRWNYWSVEEYGDQVFSFLNERGTLTLTHTGNPGNEPERFIPFTNKYPHVKLILAHIGHDETDDTLDRQIKAVRMSTQANVWSDTSSSKSVSGRLIEFAVDQIGAERVLFGSDTPLYFAPAQKARIAYAQISDEAKRRILYTNAAELLELPQNPPT